MRIRNVLLGLAGSLLFATGAAAADLPMTPPPPPPMAPPAPSFDWAGPYVGAYAGVSNYTPWFEGGTVAGYNAVFGHVLVGFDLRLGIYLPGPASSFAWQIGPGVRAGVLLGDRALLYGRLAGHYIPGWGVSWSAAGGAEFFVSHSISLFAEVQTLLPVYGVNVLGGLVWHPTY